MLILPTTRVKRGERNAATARRLPAPWLLLLGENKMNFWREVDKHEVLLEFFTSPQTTSLNHGTNNNMLFTE